MPSDKFFTFLHFSYMQKVLSILAITGVLSVTSVFAADNTGTSVTATTSTVTAVTTSTSGSQQPVMMVQPTGTAQTGPVLSGVTSEVSSAMNAASTSIVPSAGSALGEYKSVACNSSPAFATNSCNQCFVGGSVKIGDSVSGLFDNWTNATTNILIAYKDEQKLPNMVALGSTWTSTPVDQSKFWKNSADITWVPSGASGSRMNYILQPGQKVRFVEADLGAGYKLTKSDKKNGEMIGLLRFPVVSHAVDTTTGTEGAATTHYECVSYTLAQATTPTPTPTTPPPAEVTKTQTGPAETLILIVAAFFIAFGMMFSLRKRS